MSYYRKTKFSLLVAILLSLFMSEAQSSFKPPVEWEKWTKEVRERYQEKFAVPTVTHHIYLEKVGDSAFLSLSESYPRWTQAECKKCDWKVVLDASKKVQLINKKLVIDLPPEKEVAVPKHKNIFISQQRYEGDPKIRVFIFDLAQKNLSKKRVREFFKYNEGYVVMGKLHWIEKPKDVVIQRSDGSQKKIKIIAEVEYEIPGQKKNGKLSVYNFSDDKAYLENKAAMLLYRDYSNGKETYGAGRFLNVYFDKKMGDLKEGSLVKLDFNYSYNPPCAVSTGFHCPLPQDTVKLKVLAGEKYKKI